MNERELERNRQHSRHKHSRHKQSRHTRSKQIQTNIMAAHQIAYSMSQQGVPIGLTEGVQARFEVDDAHVGFMIGKKGGNVKRIRDQTNTQILIQDPDEKSGGRKWFLVRGLFKKNVASALAELAMLGNRAPIQNRGYDVPTEEEDGACVACGMGSVLTGSDFTDFSSLSFSLALKEFRKR